MRDTSCTEGRRVSAGSALRGIVGYGGLRSSTAGGGDERSGGKWGAAGGATTGELRMWLELELDLVLEIMCLLSSVSSSESDNPVPGYNWSRVRGDSIGERSRDREEESMGST